MSQVLDNETDLFVERLANDWVKLWEKAEESFERQANGELPSSDDLNLYQILNLERRQIERNTGRIGAVRAHQNGAASVGDMHRAELEAADLELSLSKEIESDEAEISRIRAAKAEKEKRIADAKRKCAVFAEKKLRLRNLVPEFKKRERENEESEIRKEFSRIPPLENRLSCIQGVLNTSPTGYIADQRNRLSHLDGARRNHPLAREAFVEVLDGNTLRHSVNETAWERYVEALRVELVEVERELATLREAKAKAQAIADEILDYYLPPDSTCDG